ncbi:MAG: hypothetical protein Q8903_08450 [Bacteroidota bacterium]|nr:hypothetical protein [Bacteroidota bacterium]
MKNTFLSCLVLCLACSFIYAQDVPIGSRHELHFYLINGYAVSYKFPSKGILNYRVNLDLGAHYGDFSGESSGEYSTDDRGNINRALSITLTPQIYVYFLSTEYARMYAGGGAFITYQYNKQHTDVSYNNGTNSYSNIIKDSRYSLGLSALIGIETELAKNIMLFAESQINGGRKWAEVKSNNFDNYGYHSRNNETTRSWFADYSNIRIGLGVYF